ncbi:hypothetical protein [Ensifer aridi]
MPQTNPKDPENLKLKLLGLFEASASGRYPITGVFVLVLLAMVGRAVGLL